jgi:hypothetical protein
MAFTPPPQEGESMIISPQSDIHGIKSLPGTKAPARKLKRKIRSALTILAVVLISFVCAPARIQTLLPNDATISTTDTERARGARVAFDGNRFLTVWSQFTDRTSFFADIYGRFVERNGDFSGPPFLVAPHQNNQTHPVIAFNGAYYLVAWYDNRGTLGNADSYNARVVSPAGQLMGSEVVIASGSNDFIAVASDGCGFLVAFEDIRQFETNIWDVTGQMIDVDINGNASLSGGNFSIAQSPTSETDPRIAFGSDKYLVAWSDQVELNSPERDVRGTFVDSLGTVGTPFPISTAPAAQGCLDISYGAGMFLVAYSDNRPDRPAGTGGYASRVSDTGGLLDGPPETGGIPLASLYGNPGIVFTGGDWFIAMGIGIRVGLDGSILSTNGPTTANGAIQSDSHVAYDGTNFLITWNATTLDNNGEWHTYMQLVTDLERPPLAAVDSYETDEGVTLSVPTRGVLTNDSDPDGDSLTVGLLTGPAHGMLTLNSDGSFTYAPNVGFSGSDVFTYQANDGSVNSDPTTVTITVHSTTLIGPATVWIGLKNSDDVGIRFDLLAEAYKNGALVGSGQLNSVAGGSSGFNNAKLQTIPVNLSGPVHFSAGDTLAIRISVRNACSGSGKNSGTARLWYDDGNTANSQVAAFLGAQIGYYLRGGFAFSVDPGPGPKKTFDMAAGNKCSAFKPFGTWSVTQ